MSKHFSIAQAAVLRSSPDLTANTYYGTRMEKKKKLKSTQPDLELDEGLAFKDYGSSSYTSSRSSHSLQWKPRGCNYQAMSNRGTRMLRHTEIGHHGQRHEYRAAEGGTSYRVWKLGTADKFITICELGISFSTWNSMEIHAVRQGGQCRRGAWTEEE
ncbi:hypothetical protein C8F04DRAFT_1191411 [Mycena alexandri]|uniref:Uncharacterized protein n=1 Tax=Mycena alexandri TaxID=1745969 RepID=A0AAD6SE12_9AGAR|nr:hypothetical protein C8F04DRAFT_1191411 [Mycena alexandri]